MAWIEDLRGKVVGLDTAPVIYYLERNEHYREMLRPFFTMVSNKECSVVTSVMTLVEGLIFPLRANDYEWERKYYTFLYSAKGVKTCDVSPNIAERAARLRATHNITAPDAIQIATAIAAHASVFLTNDAQLSSIPDIKVLVLKNLKTDS